MKITITDTGGKTFNVPLPSGLVLTPVTALIAPAVMQKHNISITYPQTAKFIHALNKYRRSHPEWVLVEVFEADGSTVEIRI